MNNVINLPEKKELKKLARLKGLKDSELRQIVLSFITICLIVVSVMMNDSLLKDERSVYLVSDSPTSSPINVEKSTRILASAHPASQHQVIEWEQDLVKKLNKESFFEGTTLFTGRAASVEDQLRYGVLAGKYRVEKDVGNSNLISHIEYVVTSDVMGRPILLDRAALLKNYRDLFSVSFTSFKLVDAEKNMGKEVYHLLDSRKSTVGKISFEMDGEGRFISMSVSSSN